MPSDIVLSDDEVTIKGKLKTEGIVNDGEISTGVLRTSGIVNDGEISTGVLKSVRRISRGEEWGIYLNDESRDILFAASFIRLQDANNPNPKDQSSVALSRDNDWLILNLGDGFKNGVMIDGKNGLKVDSINISKPDSSFYSKDSALVASDKNELVLNQGDSFANGVVIEGKNGLKVASISITRPDPKIGSKGPALVATDKNELVLNQAGSFTNGIVVEGKNGLKLVGPEGYDINNKRIRNVTSISADKIICKKQEYKVISAKKYGSKTYYAWAWEDTTTIDLLAKIDDLSKEIQYLKNRVKQLEED